MKHTQNWERDWSVCKDDYVLSEKIIPVFESYLASLIEKGASRSTFTRHKNACHALGGYIVGEVFGYGVNPFSGDETGEEILLHYIDANGGPLVHQDDETWQKELDTICKKLFRRL